MAKASDFGSEDCRFNSCQGRVYFFSSHLYKYIKLIPSCIDSLSDRPSSITTTTRQSKTKFSHFFGRSSTNNKSNQIENCLLPSSINNSSLKRTKSATKLERLKRQPQPLITTYNQSSHL